MAQTGKRVSADAIIRSALSIIALQRVICQAIAFAFSANSKPALKDVNHDFVIW